MPRIWARSRGLRRFPMAPSTAWTGKYTTHASSAVWPAGSKHTLWVPIAVQTPQARMQYVFRDWEFVGRRFSNESGDGDGELVHHRIPRGFRRVLRARPVVLHLPGFRDLPEPGHRHRGRGAVQFVGRYLRGSERPGGFAGVSESGIRLRRMAARPEPGNPGLPEHGNHELPDRRVPEIPSGPAGEPDDQPAGINAAGRPGSGADAGCPGLGGAIGTHRGRQLAAKRQFRQNVVISIVERRRRGEPRIHGAGYEYAGQFDGDLCRPRPRSTY